MSVEKSRKFKVEFLKQSGSGKWEIGYLIQSFHNQKAWVWLKDENKATVRKGSVTSHFLTKLDSCDSFVCAGYNIRVMKEFKDEQKTCSVEPKICPIEPSDRPASTVCVEKNDRVTSNHDQDAYLDPVLLRCMRPYQVEAATFLLNRLQNGPCSTSPGITPSSINRDLPLTGAILADDMGTGKTLVGLSVVWALCRHSRGKGLIVCPSSLVPNWRNEVKKWLPKIAHRAIFIASGNAGGRANDTDVHAFVSSHPSVHPLLVISYDMFRVYAEAFNTVLSLQTLLCDEGHRLKSSVGTKTSLALGNCIAMQRIVLTGTPIQNNLDELFAVINFVVPGYLGTLDEFQRNFSKVISAANEPEATPEVVSEANTAREVLSKKLQYVLIRRSGDTLLRDILPSRHEYVVSISMQSEQDEKYKDIVKSLISRDELDDTHAGGVHKRRQCNIEDGIECDRGESLSILPGLQQLRLLCSGGDTMSPDSLRGGEDSLESSCKSGNRSVTSQTGNIGNISDLLCKSTKLRALYSFLRHLNVNRTTYRDKLVIASNFISTLNALEPIIRASHHQFLRIDGSVTSEKRQHIVDMFNDETSPFTICLISVKAGGVGLNLVGANRLILFEPDYNPANDQQAVGRIWRVGQQKEVFIYRFYCKATIEESILRRQRHKNMFLAVINESGQFHGDTFLSQAPGMLHDLVMPSAADEATNKRRRISEADNDIDTKDNDPNNGEASSKSTCMTNCDKFCEKSGDSLLEKVIDDPDCSTCELIVTSIK